jgi:phage FluMu gp28-like protein
VGKEFIQLVINWGKLINFQIGKTIVDIENATTENVSLINGCKIRSLSSNPKNMRGREGLIILDEFAHHENQYELFRAATGSIARKGQLRILSTHNGHQSYFYGLVQNTDYEHMRTTIFDALKHGYRQKTWAKDKTDEDYIKWLKISCNGSEDIFNQEFNCLAMDSSKSLLHQDEIKKQQLYDLEDNDVPAKDNGRQSFIFIDVGRIINLTVVTRIERIINEQAENEYERFDFLVTHVLALENEPLQSQAEKIKAFLSRNKAQAVGIDNRGMGVFLADVLQEVVPNIIRVNATNKSNEIMYETLVSFIRTDRINIPKGEVFFNDFLALKRIINGITVRYTGINGNSHIDYVNSIAGALALARSEENNGTIFLTPD